MGERLEYGSKHYLETWSFLTLNYSCLAEQLCIIENIPTQITMANIISMGEGHANGMDASTGNTTRADS